MAGGRRARRLAVVVAAGASAALGCACGPPSPECRPWPADPRISFPLEPAVDLLLVVDDSHSMAGEQARLAAALPEMLRALADGDVDADGAVDFPPPRSVHVGVVTTDLGAGPAVPAGVRVPSCEAGLGDDGILRTEGTTTRAGCARRYPPIFSFGIASGGDPAAIARDVACVAVAGTGGCGFEQQLEAALKALAASSPSADYVPAGYAPPIFAGGTPGHGDDINAGFLRRRSVLALVLLTDEEDCSVPDYSLFYRDPRFVDVGLNLRCFAFPEQLYPTSRYVESLLQLRAGPRQLVFAAIAGVPVDLAGGTIEAYDAALADPRMIETPDPSASPPTRLLASCATPPDVEGGPPGEAFPPRRSVSVARGLALRGAGMTVESICEGDLGPALRRVVELVGDAFPTDCLADALVRAGDGRVACTARERLASASSGAAVTRCADVGLELVEIEIDASGEHEVCALRQLTTAEVSAGLGPGWHYDASPEAVAVCGPFHPTGQRLVLDGHAPPPGSQLRLDCELGARAPEIGWDCVPGPETPGFGTPENPCPAAWAPGTDAGVLTCEPISRTCQVPCDLRS